MHAIVTAETKTAGCSMSDSKPNEGALDHILYLLVLPQKGSGEYSPFQGFSLNTFEVITTILQVCKLPPTIAELFLTRDEAISYRVAGLAGYSIVLLDLEFLSQFEGGLPYTCIVSCKGTFEAVQSHIEEHGRRGWLHLTTDEASSGIQKLQNFSRSDMYSWSRGIVEEILAERAAAGTGIAELQWRPFVEWPPSRIELPSQSHNITLPTEVALRSLGFTVTHGSRNLTGGSDEIFADAMVENAALLEGIRDRATADRREVPGTPRLILTVPSVFRHLSPSGLKRETVGPIRRVFRHILRQQQYIAMRATGPETADILRNPVASGFLALRASELRAYSAALSVTAASLCAPVLRCPPQVDRVRELIIRLTGLSRGSRPNIERRNKLARDIGATLRSAIPDPLFRKIEQHQNEGIKLIGDTPFELLTVNDLPLGLRATTSRMPTLPGNLLMRHSLCRTSTLFQLPDLKSILVVRAFDINDPLRGLLVQTVEEVNAANSNAIDLKVVDVHSKDEFIAAFNDFDGTLAIFDGHGAHGRSDPQGTIFVGPIQFNPFELYGKVRIPPIVFLSACETHTLEGMESSVASAFLLMGARSVLGTLAPIKGLNAALLIARFVLRFSEFLPLVKSTMPWSQVVSGMLRMSYVTDVLMEMQRRFSFGRDIYLEVHNEANIAINRFQSGWFEQLLTSLSKKLSLSEIQVRDTWLRTCYFTETLNYVHLGQPEHIFIVPTVPPTPPRQVS
jgi:hypothetical protein